MYQNSHGGRLVPNESSSYVGTMAMDVMRSRARDGDFLPFEFLTDPAGMEV